jgi:signal transduction histidine kinase
MLGNSQGTTQLSDVQQLEGVAAPVDAPAAGKMHFFSGLRGRLLLMTAGFVLFAEFLIYPVLTGTFRNNWLGQRAQAAQIAALAVEASPDGRVSEELSIQLLAKAQVISVAVQEKEFRGIILPPSIEIGRDLVTVDLRQEAGLGGIAGAFGHMFAPEGRFLRILLAPTLTKDEEMEVIVPEAALKDALLAFSRTLFVVSLIVSAVVGALVYFAIYRLVVRPMQRLTDGIVRFANAPEGAEIAPMPGESDEMQRANLALQAMQRTVSAAFRQRKRLAELGEAVAKINHDLRNSLAAAQIVSEGLAQSEDPRVKRAAPRLERAIQRAVNLAESTLRFGRATPAEPNLLSVNLVSAVEEAAAEGLAGASDIDWRLDVVGPGNALVDADHVHRIIANLVRNAARAIKDQPGRSAPGRISARISREGPCAIIEIADNGPGVPASVVGRLFQPFSGSASRGGAGLGLAIARELARGMRGDLVLSNNGPSGAAFTLRVPASA